MHGIIDDCFRCGNHPKVPLVGQTQRVRASSFSSDPTDSQRPISSAHADTYSLSHAPELDSTRLGSTQLSSTSALGELWLLSDGRSIGCLNARRSTLLLLRSCSHAATGTMSSVIPHSLTCQLVPIIFASQLGRDLSERPRRAI